MDVSRKTIGEYSKKFGSKEYVDSYWRILANQPATLRMFFDKMDIEQIDKKGFRKRNLFKTSVFLLIF